MSELIKERVRESEGKEVTIFLINNFRYSGKIINTDEEYVELLDYRSNSYKIINLNQIKEMEVKV